jgi:drug/metabolite transporter (DMT)-like permease
VWGVGSALLAAALWALSGTLLTSQTSRIDPIPLSALRCLFATAFLAVLLPPLGAIGDLRDISFNTAISMVGSGVVGMGLGDTLYIASLGMIGVSRAYPISMSSYPLLTFLLAVTLLGETVTWVMLLGAVLIIVGVSLLVVEGRAETTGGAALRRGSPGRGVALVLLAAVFWAVATVWLRAGSGDLSAVAAGSLRIPAAGLFLLLLSWGRMGELRVVAGGRRTLATVALAGIVGTALGGLLYIYAVQEAGAGRAAILSSTSPLFLFPMAVIFLAERLTAWVLVGTAISVVGIWLVI